VLPVVVPVVVVLPETGPVRRQGEGRALAWIRDLNPDHNAYRKRDGDQGGD
jgi:hypothetical protein